MAVSMAFAERRQAGIAREEAAEARRMEQSLARAMRGRRTFGVATGILFGVDAYLGAKATYANMYPVYNLASIGFTIGAAGTAGYLHTKVGEIRERLANARRQ